LYQRRHDEQALTEQQSLDRVIAALENAGSYTLVLLDEAFGKSEGGGQIVEFLVKKYESEIVVETAASGAVGLIRSRPSAGGPRK
jgi:hypothetical protein